MTTSQKYTLTLKKRNEQAAEKIIPSKKMKILKIKDDPALSYINHQNIHDTKRKIKNKFENLQTQLGTNQQNHGQEIGNKWIIK